jgi:hypothetical protein
MVVHRPSPSGMAQRRGFNPQDHLTNILARLPSSKITHLHELLPGNWKPESGSAG